MGATLRIILFAWILLLGGLPDSFAHIPAKIATRSLPQAIRGEVESGASLTFKPTASVQRYTRDTTDYYKASITRPTASTNQFIYVTNTASLPPMMDLPAVSTTNVTAVYIPVSNTFLYDNAGNTTSDGYWDYTWDGYNRLTKVESKANAPIASRRSIVFKYDAGGRRIARVTSAADATGVYRETDSRKFVYNGWKLVAELNGTNNAVIRSYLWAGNQLLAINQNNIQYLPTFDGQGNVMSLIQADNLAVVARYDYSPFGILLRASGPMALENPIHFSSEYQDDVTGFIYYGYRYYNPTTQTWLSRDPIGMAGGFNLYALVDNDPVNGRDYLGLMNYELHVEISVNALVNVQRQLGLSEADFMNLMRGVAQGSVFPDLQVRVPIPDYTLPEEIIKHVKGINVCKQVKSFLPNMVIRAAEWYDREVDALQRETVDLFLSGYAETREGVENWWTDTPPVIWMLLQTQEGSGGFAGRVYDSHMGRNSFQHAMSSGTMTAQDVQGSLITGTVEQSAGFTELTGQGSYFDAGFRLGVALHYLQYSYSPAHASREGGLISAFHDYSKQRTPAHEAADCLSRGSDPYKQAMKHSQDMIRDFMNGRLSSARAAEYYRLKSGAEAGVPGVDFKLNENTIYPGDLWDRLKALWSGGK